MWDSFLRIVCATRSKQAEGRATKQGASAPFGWFLAVSLITVMSGELLESCERMICPRISQAQQISSGINERWIDDLILFFFETMMILLSHKLHCCRFQSCLCNHRAGWAGGNYLSNLKETWTPTATAHVTWKRILIVFIALRTQKDDMVMLSSLPEINSKPLSGASSHVTLLARSQVKCNKTSTVSRANSATASSPMLIFILFI